MPPPVAASSTSALSPPAACHCSALAPVQWPAAAVGRQQQRQRSRQQQQHRCRADPAALQEVLVGGAVFAAAGASLVNGMQTEPTVCESCAGSGGIVCIICEGSGKSSMSREALAAASKQRDPLGGSRSKRECVACKGVGKILCRGCSGSGYSKKL